MTFRIGEDVFQNWISKYAVVEKYWDGFSQRKRETGIQLEEDNLVHLASREVAAKYDLNFEKPPARRSCVPLEIDVGRVADVILFLEILQVRKTFGRIVLQGLLALLPVFCQHYEDSLGMTKAGAFERNSWAQVKLTSELVQPFHNSSAFRKGQDPYIRVDLRRK
jgi:hypothetical protein